jgi:uncharacterized RDD family membrane protein YckC
MVVTPAEDPVLSWKQAVFREIGDIILNIGWLVCAVHLIFTREYVPPQEISGSVVMLVLGYGSLAWSVMEFATMLSNAKRRALHDFIAGTVVIRMR